MLSRQRIAKALTRLRSLVCAFVIRMQQNRDTSYPLPGGPCRKPQRAFMYRSEHGVVSFMLDDDTCECWSTLSAGHSMCLDGFQSSWGTENMYGVGLLNENGCDGPSDTNSLFMYYRGRYMFCK